MKYMYMHEYLSLCTPVEVFKNVIVQLQSLLCFNEQES